MMRSKEEKYLGNKITDDGSNRTNIKSRTSKSYGIAAEIISIVNEIPFGPHQLEVAIQLRESMLINGILTNIEVSHGLSENEIKELEKADEFLIRQILKGHSKTSIEMLYLETGILPIKYIIISRRLSFLIHILNQNYHELIAKVNTAQKRKKTKNDWFP